MDDAADMIKQIHLDSGARYYRELIDSIGGNLGFFSAVNEINQPPRYDFTDFLPWLGDCDNVIISVPAMLLAEAEIFVNNLPKKQFLDGTRLTLLKALRLPNAICFPTAVAIQTIWLRPPAPPIITPAESAPETGWVHYARLVIHQGTTARPLQVIHVGLDERATVYNFLVAHRLIPKQIVNGTMGNI